jgi:voltage-gated potassium channel
MTLCPPSTARKRMMMLVCLFIAPTRVLMTWRRQGKTPEVAAAMLFHWTRGFFVAAVVLCCATLLMEQFPGRGELVMGVCRVVIIALAVSRCNETMIAFCGDARQWLEGRPAQTRISPVHRLGFVIQSYAELWLFIALIGSNLPQWMYQPPIHNDILTSIYFSGVTISTLGYGEIHPTMWVSQFLALYEVFSGLFLIVMAIGIYLDRAAHLEGPPR